jgi:hypothetical protein
MADDGYVNIPLSFDIEKGDEKMVGMAALLGFIECERKLRPFAQDLKTNHPELWTKQIAGLQAELENPKWEVRRLTLDPLIKMLSPYLGTNDAALVLPYYRDEYDLACQMRNSLAHGNWERMEELGGLPFALLYARHLFGLVSICTSGKDDFTMFALQHHMILGGAEWPWPKRK